MGRIGSHPTTIDQYKRISINFFKRYDLLKDDIHYCSTIQFSTNGEKTGSVGYEIDTINGNKFVRFHYTRTNRFTEEKKDIDYTVQFTSVPSNLGNGKKWYFICPSSGKRCIYLYESECHDYFLHRDLTGAYYDSQLRSKRYRMLDKLYGDFIKSENDTFYSYGKYRKKHYKGKPTKWYAEYKRIQESSLEFYRNGGLDLILMK